MTWKTFMSAIEKAELMSGNQSEILISLFKSAGYISKKEDGISLSAARSWINGVRNCKVSSYFPNNQLGDLKEAYKFFRYRHADRLEKLQQILSKKKDDNSPIDCETEDMDIFCCSLVNQFLDLLGFQRVDITEILPDKKTVSDSQISDDETASGDQTSNDETESDNQTSDDGCGGTEAEFITSENNKESNMNQTNSQNTFLGAQLSIPKDCKICLYCENWKGNKREALESASGAYGRCIHLKKDMLSKELKCEGFIERWGLITKYIYSHHDKSKF